MTNKIYSDGISNKNISISITKEDFWKQVSLDNNLENNILVLKKEEAFLISKFKTRNFSLFFMLWNNFWEMKCDNDVDTILWIKKEDCLSIQIVK